MGRTPPDDPWEDDDAEDFAPFDRTVDGEESEGAGLDAFDMYLPIEDSDELPAAHSPGGPGQEDQRPVLLFTVANPSGTVSVSTFIDARIHQIELSAEVVKMSESELSNEIRLVAGLAQKKARAAQYALLLGGMVELGHDSVETGGILEREFGLPSPDQVRAEMVQVFNERYAGDGD